MLKLESGHQNRLKSSFSNFALILAIVSAFTLGCKKSVSTTAKKPKERSITPARTNYEPGKEPGTYRILHWNIESGGADPQVIAKELVELGRYDVYALSEVADHKTIENEINTQWPEKYKFFVGDSGRALNSSYADDRLMVIVDRGRFEDSSATDLNEINGTSINDGRHRSPLLVQLRDRATFQQLQVVQNHFPRRDSKLRQHQARLLREWARDKSEPVVVIGDLSLDYDFNSGKGNNAFDEMMKDRVFKWIRPNPLVDTNWSDSDGDGKDNYPDSMRDFSFVAGGAKGWDAKCNVIVRDGDFPDDDKTSDHRPVELILQIPTE